MWVEVEGPWELNQQKEAEASVWVGVEMSLGFDRRQRLSFSDDEQAKAMTASKSDNGKQKRQRQASKSNNGKQKQQRQAKAMTAKVTMASKSNDGKQKR